MLSDNWLSRYRLLENTKCEGNDNGKGNAHDHGDYNSSFALCAVELKTTTNSSNCLHYKQCSSLLDDEFKLGSHDKVQGQSTDKGIHRPGCRLNTLGTAYRNYPKFSDRLVWANSADQ